MWRPTFSRSRREIILLSWLLWMLILLFLLEGTEAVSAAQLRDLRPALVEIAPESAFDSDPWETGEFVADFTMDDLPEIIFPQNRVHLASTTLFLLWSAGRGATAYRVVASSYIVGADIYDGSPGTERWAIFPIPGDGRHIFVTLWGYFPVFDAWFANPVVFYAPDFDEPEEAFNSS